MQICFPVEIDKGLDSDVFGHFGSAPFFVVFDTENKSIHTINNQDLGHVHGMCNPLKALNGRPHTPLALQTNSTWSQKNLISQSRLGGFWTQWWSNCAQLFARYRCD